MHVFLYNILAPILADTPLSLKALLLESLYKCMYTPYKYVVCTVVWKHYQYKLWWFDLIRWCIPRRHLSWS